MYFLSFISASTLEDHVIMSLQCPMPVTGFQFLLLYIRALQPGLPTRITREAFERHQGQSCTPITPEWLDADRTCILLS